MAALAFWQFFLLFCHGRERGTDFAEEGAVVRRKAGGPRAAEGDAGRGRAGGRRSVAVATDMGYYDDRVRDHLLGLDTALLESNHDRGMLANGPYPVSLKRRIMSREGHLSNNSCGRLLSEIAGPSLKQVFLGHLSRDNNTPQLALATVEQEYRTLCQEANREPRLPKLCVAPHDGLSQIFRM